MAIPQKMLVRAEPRKAVAAVGRATSPGVPRRYGLRGQLGEQAVADRMPLAMKEHTATRLRLDIRARPHIPLLGGQWNE